MAIQKNSALKRYDDKPILIDTFVLSNELSQPIVIFCHGYKGFKDWGAWDLMAKEISKAGACFVKFNFSHNGGTLEQPIDFPDLEAFGSNNYTQELKDLDDVISWSVDHFKSNPNVDTNRIILIGHSRGGGIVLIKANEDDRVTKVITLAGVSDYKSRFVSGDALNQWQKDGVMYITNGRTKQQMPHYYQFYQDFIDNEARLTIKTAVTALKKPYVIIHGTNDPTVSVDSAKTLHQWQPESQLKLIEDADHVFNTKHPWKEDKLSDALLKVSNLVINALKKE